MFSLRNYGATFFSVLQSMQPSGKAVSSIHMHMSLIQQYHPESWLLLPSHLRKNAMESLSKVLIPTPHNSQGHMLQVSSAQETALFVLKSKMPPYVSRKDQNRGEEEVVLKVRRNRAFSLALKREPRVHSPLVLRLVDDQEDLELPHAWRRRRRLDQPGGRGRLLHHVGDGAEEARATGLPPLRSR